MVKLSLRVQSVKDAAEGTPVVEGITRENAEEAKDITICIQEAGTQSGQTSLMILFKMADGTFKYGQITKNHLDALNGAVAGAEQRFKDEFNNLMNG